MALPVRINAVGTMADQFKIGKAGPTISQGAGDPSDGSGSVGDLYVRYGSPPRLFIKDSAGWRPVADQAYGYVRQVVSTSTATVGAKVNFVSVTNTSGATITLPTGVDGRSVFIKDESGTATSNPITILPDGSNTIDGRTSERIGVDLGWVQLVFWGTVWRIVGRPTAPLRRSDILVITNPATLTYSLLAGGSAMPLNEGFALVYLNRNLLRATEYSLANDQITFSITLSEDDEVEVVTGPL